MEWRRKTGRKLKYNWIPLLTGLTCMEGYRGKALRKSEQVSDDLDVVDDEISLALRQNDDRDKSRIGIITA